MPYLLPERGRVVDAPSPKLVVRWQVQFILLSYMLFEGIDLCAVWI